MQAKDCHGNPIRVGSSIRVLAVPDMEKSLEPEEWARVKSMLGDILEVYEIDEYGRAWVEKWWRTGSDASTCHSISLAATEMELVKPQTTPL